jgi:hypothetical protein
MPIQILDIEDKTPARVGFWRRQFQAEATPGQKKFDWLFGVVLPVICVLFDPVVFSGRALGPALLGAYKPFAFILSFVSIVAMIAWLIWGARLKWLNAILSGFFLLGGLVSLCVGAIILPFSLIGLMLLFIGALGFTPFFAGFVFLRNAYRAFRQAQPLIEKKVLVGSIVLSAMFGAVIPWTINNEIERSIDKMVKGSPETIRSTAQRLKYVSIIINYDRIAYAYLKTQSEGTSEKTEALAAAYAEMTGRELELETRMLLD